MEDIYHQFQDLIRQANFQTLEQLRQMVSLAEQERRQPGATCGEDREWLAQLQARVQKKLSAPDYSIPQLAYELAMSESSLLRRLYRLCGLTPKQYITEQRLLRARNLLESRCFPCIEQVSYAVGFRDAKAFSRCFKRRFGAPPSIILQQTATNN